MFIFFYNVLMVSFQVVCLPYFLFKYRKYKGSVLKRFFPSLKKLKKPKINQKVIWVHAVSVGETKAISNFLKKVKDKDPNSFIIISNITKTGQYTAKRLIPYADEYLFLPIDTYFNMKRMVSYYQPNFVFISETDIWYMFLYFAKKCGAKISLINGKISEKSYKFYKKFIWMFKNIYKNIDNFFLQNDLYQNRFQKLGIRKDKIVVTSNLKIYIREKKYSEKELNSYRNKFKLSQNDKVLVVASTHENEEKMILEKLFHSYKIFLAPRHPERFEEVKNYLKSSNISFISYSEIENIKGNETFIFIDKMGMLNLCFQLSNLAIVGGSFVNNVGGHNILEPILAGKFVLFGPHMYNQKDLVDICIENNIGKMIDEKKLLKEVSNFFENKDSLEKNVFKYLSTNDLDQEKIFLKILKKIAL